jgi:hypothetical protein
MHVSLLITILCLSVSSCTPSDPNAKTRGARIASKNTTVVTAQKAVQTKDPKTGKTNKKAVAILEQNSSEEYSKPKNSKLANKKPVSTKATLPEESESFFAKPSEFFAGLTNIKPYHGRSRGVEITSRSKAKEIKKGSAKANKSVAKKPGNKSVARVEQQQLSKQVKPIAAGKPIGPEKPVAAGKPIAAEKPVAAGKPVVAEKPVAAEKPIAAEKPTSSQKTAKSSSS